LDTELVVNLTSLDFSFGQPSTERFVSHAGGLDCLGQGYPNLNVVAIAWGGLTISGLVCINWENFIDHRNMSTAVQDSTTGQSIADKGMTNG
jgi:hypothetical protein